MAATCYTFRNRGHFSIRFLTTDTNETWTDKANTETELLCRDRKAQETDSGADSALDMTPLQTFRVLALAAVVHAEDEGLQDEGHDNGHHHHGHYVKGHEVQAAPVGRLRGDAFLEGAVSE